MKAVVFRNEAGNQEYRIPVIDKFPDLDLDVDGKWVIEVSLPLFVEMASHMGLFPVKKDGEEDER